MSEDRLREALEWYATEAEAIGRHMNKDKGEEVNVTALTAAMQVLAIDGGYRARAALTQSAITPTGSFAAPGSTTLPTNVNKTCCIRPSAPDEPLSFEPEDYPATKPEASSQPATCPTCPTYPDHIPCPDPFHAAGVEP